MQDTIQRQILSALLLFLRPIARALLRAGVGYREFSEISKLAFVETATKDYGLRGRPTNISRVAVMTGLTRKEVRRLRDKVAAGQETFVLRATPMSTILHRWYTDSEFLDAGGKPAILNFDGPQPSFSSLVKKHGGDIPPGAMRTELKRINAVREISGHRLEVLKRNVSGLDVHERLVTGLANVLYPAALTFAHNTNCEKEETWVQRSAVTKSVRVDDISRLKRISSDRLAELAEAIDDLFVAYEALYDEGDANSAGRTVGVGVFYFEEDKGDIDRFN